jgi:meso-butanediol dehydrogenase/(S,S)-butanediol dehydrogenase/diacetyl reductase
LFEAHSHGIKSMKKEKNTQPVVVITGGARGIGLEITQQFLSKNYRVAILDIDKPTLTKTETQLKNDNLLAIHCDVSKPQKVAAAVAKIEKKFGRIDSLVNNAGVAIFKPILEITWKDWRHIMDTNLDGTFLCTQACAPIMLKHGGGSVPAPCAWLMAPAKVPLFISPNNRRLNWVTSAFVSTVSHRALY